MPMLPRSYLFVPSDRPERFARALACGVDSVIIDLEDAVAPARKEMARAALAQWLEREASAQGMRAGCPVLVRVNSADTRWFAEDLALCAHPGIAGVMLPKAARVDELDALAAALPGRDLLALVETAAGMANARALAAHPGVTRLVFGTVDFQLDLDIDGEGDELLAFRSELVLASRLAGIAAPIDGVETAIDDEERLRDATGRARRLGFGAKLCIHPKQVDAVNAGFCASPAALDWARRVLAAAEAAQGGAVALDGRMIDAPVIARARRLLGAARSD